MSEEEIPEGEGLIAYRLGRVERLVESYNTSSNRRDDRVVDKLDEFGKQLNRVEPEITHLKYRVGKLETSLSTLYKCCWGLAVVVAGVLIQALVEKIVG